MRLVAIVILAFAPAFVLYGCGGSPAGGSVHAPVRPAARPAVVAVHHPTITMSMAAPSGVPNFHVVHPGLLRGGAPTPEGLKNLKKIGVKTVIDLRIAPKTVAKEKKRVEALGMTWINLPMSGDPPTLREINTFMHNATTPSDQPVFVHCQHGADRTGAMVGIYRETIDHWPYAKTFKEMRHYGLNPVYHGLVNTVRRYAPHT